ELVAGEGDLAAVGRQQPGKTVEEGGLPGAVGPDDTGDLGRAGGEVDAVEGVDATEVNGEILDLEDLAPLHPPLAGGQRALDQLSGDPVPGRLEPGELGRVEHQRRAVAVVPVAVSGETAAFGHEAGGPPPGFGAEDLPAV